MALTVEDVEKLAAIVSVHRLDALEFDGVRITKTMHDPVVVRRQPAPPPHDDEPGGYPADEALAAVLGGVK